MANKTYQARVQSKIDTSENWAKATNFVPLNGEICIYSDLHRMKVGDGTSKIGDLDFEKSTWITTVTATSGNMAGNLDEQLQQRVDFLYYAQSSASGKEIKAAYDAGFEVKAVYKNSIFSLSQFDNTSLYARFVGLTSFDENYVVRFVAINLYFGDNSAANDDMVVETIFRQIPKVFTADNDKILKVVNGAWAASALDKSSFVVNFTLSEDKTTATADKTTAEISNASENGQIVVGLLTGGDFIAYILQFNGITIGGPIFSTVMNFRDIVQTITLGYNDITNNYDVIDEKIESFTDAEIETFYNANA